MTSTKTCKIIKHKIASKYIKQFQKLSLLVFHLTCKNIAEYIERFRYYFLIHVARHCEQVKAVDENLLVYVGSI